MATYEELEARLAALERLVLELRLEKLAKVFAWSESKKSAKSTRKTREYTDEQRAAIRERLIAGQEAARKQREAEAKPTKKVRVGNSDKVKALESEKLAEA